MRFAPANVDKGTIGIENLTAQMALGAPQYDALHA